MFSPEVITLGQKALNNLLFIAPLLAVSILIIFLLNKLIKGPNGRTNNKVCSIAGIIIFPILFVVACSFKWELSFWKITICVASGAIIGALSFTLDELLSDFWQNKRVTVPAALGLLCGASLFITMFTGTWLEGNMYVTHEACANRVVIERYTRHSHTDNDGKTTYSYSWDYESHADKVAMGRVLPQLVEGKDYRLGRGYGGKKDRVGRHENYFFIGGHFWSEKSEEWKPFRWLRLQEKIEFNLDSVQLIRSNFYGNPIENGGPIRAPRPVPEKVQSVKLPTDLPPGDNTVKALAYGADFVKVLFTQEEYRGVALIIGGINLILVVLMIIVAPLRGPIGIFLICASIIILIILLIVAARTGSVGAFTSGGRRRSGGSGGFGGRAYSR